MLLNMAYIASIWKLYGNGGLLSMLVDSDVYAPATARLMLEGKQVSRGSRGYESHARCPVSTIEAFLGVDATT